MPVAQGDLSLKRASANTTDPLLNGGSLTSVAVGATLLPDVSGDDRTAGVVRWRKIFLKNEAGVGTAPEKISDATLTLVNAKLFLLNTTAGDDYVLIKAATDKTGVQDGETDADWKGTGALDADVAADDITLDVRMEIDGSAGELFADGDSVLIISGSIREFVTLDNPGGVSWVDNIASLVFTATPLQHDFTAILTETATIYTANTIGVTGWAMTTNEHAGRRLRIVSGTGAGQKRRIISNGAETFTVEYDFLPAIDDTSVFEVDLTSVCACAAVGDVACSYDNVSVTSVAGTFDPGIVLYPIGCTDGSWELLFGAGGTTYTLTCDALPGQSWVYSTGVDAQPSHGASYYLKLEGTAFGGTFEAGDTITFDTVSASAAAWLKNVVPAGANPHRANAVDIGASGDTL